jgi:hypothetical protein
MTASSPMTNRDPELPGFLSQGTRRGPRTPFMNNKIKSAAQIASNPNGTGSNVASAASSGPFAMRSARDNASP